MRVFLAIELPPNLQEKIFEFGQKITEGWKIKLVEKENLHLTLLFLGEITEKEKDRLVEELEEQEGQEGLVKLAGRQKGISLRLGKMEVFPSPKKAHGIWINVEGDKEKLFFLYKKIVDKTLAAGIKLDNKQLRFSPHITIGRIKGKAGDLGSASWRMGDLGEKFEVDKIALFVSKLTSKGPLYTKIGEFEVK